MVITLHEISISYSKYFNQMWLIVEYSLLFVMRQSSTGELQIPWTARRRNEDLFS